MDTIEVEVFTILTCAIMGAWFATQLSMRSKWVTFWAAVRHSAVEIGARLSVRPLVGLAVVRFSHLVPGSKNWAKLGTGESAYPRFCFQLLNELIVSCFDKQHCLGARLVIA